MPCHSIQRGYLVYKEVFAACHSLNYITWHNLAGVSHTADEVKAMAKEVKYTIQCIYLLQWFQVLLHSLPLLGLHLSTCNMATLYELELCLKSIWNIEKITKVSKCFSELNAHMWFIVMF